MLKSIKFYFVVQLIFIIIEMLAFIFMKDVAYLFPWGITGLLLIKGLLSLIALLAYMMILIVRAIRSQSIYFTLKKWAVAALWVLMTPWFIALQIILSETMTYSPQQEGIADIVSVEINGSTQYYSLRTQDLDHPIILFLSGGPGGAQIPTTRRFLSELEDTYTIINWDQPGTAKSYDARYRVNHMTPDVYLDDAHQLTQHLKSHYQKDKVYIIGESWGSYLAVELVTQYPEDYYAMIGTGQMVDFMQTEKDCYQFVLDLAEQNHQNQLINKLLDLGEPPYQEPNLGLKMNTYLGVIYTWMETHPDVHHPDWDTFDLLISPEYSIWDSVHIAMGLINTFGEVYPHLENIDLRETHQTFDLPINFFEGKYDQNAPTYLVREFYDVIVAPEKEYVEFEHSAHNPWINEYERFCEEVKLRFTQHENE